MINRLFFTVAVIVGLAGLVPGMVMAEDNGIGTLGVRSSLVIGDVNEAELLSSILDEYIEDDPNEPEEYVPVGGGGGSAGSSSGLHSSNPFGGSSGASGLLPTSAAAAPQSTGPAPYADTLFECVAGADLPNQGRFIGRIADVEQIHLVGVAKNGKTDGVRIDADAVPGKIDLVGPLLEGQNTFFFDECGEGVVEPDYGVGPFGQSYEFDAGPRGDSQGDCQ